MITVLWFAWLCMAIALGVCFFFILVRIVMWFCIAAYRVARWIGGKPNAPRQMSRLPRLSPYLGLERKPVTTTPEPTDLPTEPTN